MDPDANLQEQRELREELEGLVKRYNELVADPAMRRHLIEEVSDSIQDKTGRLLELLEALDDWLKAAGFLPVGWQRDFRPPAGQDPAYQGRFHTPRATHGVATTRDHTDEYGPIAIVGVWYMSRPFDCGNGLAVLDRERGRELRDWLTAWLDE